ncbi:MAG: ectoine synthase, partial [Phenylobacterium sp.]|nr:ectoine synthase [Phenylobacterium sp.]
LERRLPVQGKNLTLSLDIDLQLVAERKMTENEMAGATVALDIATGEVHQIKAGVMYALDKHDKHILRAKSEMKMACVFNPPLNGLEVHDETGAYPLEAETV